MKITTCPYCQMLHHDDNHNGYHEDCYNMLNSSMN
jgi:hypothetical protein